MFKKKYFFDLNQTFKGIDWKLLLFLLLFLNVKLIVKMIAIALIYALRFDFKFGFRARNSRLPLFYPAIIFLAIINYFISAGFYHFNYSITFTFGLFFWALAVLAVHQVKLSVDSHTPAVIHNTINSFFIINAIFSLSTLLIIIFKTGALNPYLYQGEYQKYFIGTGDYIKGVSFDTSTTNGILNAFGVIYFLDRKKPLMVLLCMSILLLTASNITNILLSVVLTYVFIFQTGKVQKSLILICFYLLIVFVTKVSPQNNSYIINSVEHIWDNTSAHKQAETSNLSVITLPDSVLTADEIKQKTALLYLDSLSSAHLSRPASGPVHAKNVLWVIPTDDINGPLFQHKSFLTPVEENMFDFIRQHKASLPISSDPVFKSKYPGKVTAWKQTYTYLSSHPSKIITGAGVGNFSSKVAFKATGIGIAGSWPSKFVYINKAFLQNHLDLYLYYFSKSDGYHSTINSPASVYDQLIAEYGVAGLAAWFLFYIVFFIRRCGKRSYAVPLIFLLTGIFFFDYWFEQLSIVILFELFLFLNIKETDSRYE